MTDAPPVDFSVTYEWWEGSLPPPYHYSYRITMDRTGGVIRFVAGYAFQNPPTWTATFPVPEATRAELHARLSAAGPLPPAAEAAQSVGGSIASLEWSSGGRTVTLSSQGKGDKRPTFDDLAESVRRLVPAELWGDLHARLRAFQKGETQ